SRLAECPAAQINRFSAVHLRQRIQNQAVPYLIEFQSWLVSRRLFRVQGVKQVTRAGVENLVVSRGTDGSNPAPSSKESSNCRFLTVDGAENRHHDDAGRLPRNR